MLLVVVFVLLRLVVAERIKIVWARVRVGRSRLAEKKLSRRTDKKSGFLSRSLNRSLELFNPVQ